MVLDHKQYRTRPAGYVPKSIGEVSCALREMEDTAILFSQANPLRSRLYSYRLCFLIERAPSITLMALRNRCYVIRRLSNEVKTSNPIKLTAITIRLRVYAGRLWPLFRVAA